MALLPIFSRRKRQMARTGSDVFSYGVIPPKVRVQLFMNIWEGLGALENGYESRDEIVYEIVKELREEAGTNNLTGKFQRTVSEEFEAWFLNHASTDEVLDALELWCMFAGHVAENHGWNGKDRYLRSVERVNARLLEAGLGYGIVDGVVIEKSNELLHSTVVLPALHLLSEQRFANANKEFAEAHNAYRGGEYEDCITDCLKAFESVMKVLAAERGWQVASTAPAKTLIAALFDNQFVPSFMRSQFDGLRSLLESSVPTTRNRAGAHGKGTEQRIIPPSLAALQLHQTAALVVFLGALDSP